MEQITNAGPVGIILMIVLGVLLLILAIFWLIFPWFVHSKLTAIERNTQKSAQALDLILTTLTSSHAAQLKTEENTRTIANQNVRT